ncbi:hypothetical protein JMUB7547_27940 [Staphylococcus aureus]
MSASLVGSEMCIRDRPSIVEFMVSKPKLYKKGEKATFFMALVCVKLSCFVVL